MCVHVSHADTERGRERERERERERDDERVRETDGLRLLFFTTYFFTNFDLYLLLHELETDGCYDLVYACNLLLSYDVHVPSSSHMTCMYPPPHGLEAAMIWSSAITRASSQ